MIVTLAQLQAHLRLPVGAGSPYSDDEVDMQLKIEIAQGLVLGYIARPDDADWTARIADWVEGATVSPAAEIPAVVKGAILMQAGELWGFRGDDTDQPKREAPGDLSPTIKALLNKYRDPTAR